MYFHHPTLRAIIRESYFSQNANPIHAGYVTLFMGLFFPTRWLVGVTQFADKIFYPQYQQQTLGAPIFITGNPRSGTTFLHRLLMDDPQFTSTKLYHTIFPSVSFYRCVEMLGRLGSQFDQRFTHAIEWLDKKGFGGWQGIHKTQLNGFEEDETLFVWTLLSPVISLLFPFAQNLPSATWVDQLPQPTRQQLMDYYQDCLKRHLYATGTEKTLLIKNTTSTGRIQSMLDALPDSRLIHLIRHPYQAIPSLLSMYAVSWQKFAPQTHKNAEAYETLAQLYAQYYRVRMQLFKKMNRDCLMEIRYETLIADPLATITTIYQTFGLEMGKDFRHQLQHITQQQQHYQSRHHYSLEQFGLTSERLYQMMPDVFEYYGFAP